MLKENRVVEMFERSLRMARSTKPILSNIGYQQALAYGYVLGVNQKTIQEIIKPIAPHNIEQYKWDGTCYDGFLLELSDGKKIRMFGR